MLTWIVWIIVLAWVVYAVFWKRPKGSQSYMRKAVDAELLFMRPRAIRILQQGLGDPLLSHMEKGNLYMSLGVQYCKQKDYEAAAKAFDEGLERIKRERLMYTPNFVYPIKAYLRTGQREKAERLYEDLMKRTSYDPNFAKLEKKLGDWMRNNG